MVHAPPLSLTRRRAAALLSVFLVVLVPLSLWPFTFWAPCDACENRARISSGGLILAGDGMIVDDGGARALHGSLAGGDALSILVRAESASRHLFGPARIVTFSDGAAERNLTVGQQRRDLHVRLRTPATGPNGTDPEFVAPGVVRPGREQVFVATYDGRRARLYVDGEMAVDMQAAFGPLADWNPAYRVLYGNETTGDRAWHGRLRDVAIYDRALSPREALNLSDRGAEPAVSGAVYRLGARCPLVDSAGPGGSGACTVPPTFDNARPLVLLAANRRGVADYAQNLALHLGLGALLALVVAPGPADRRARALVLLCATVPLTAELAQAFVMGRTSSLHDLLSAWLGLGAGYLLVVRRGRPTGPRARRAGG